MTAELQQRLLRRTVLTSDGCLLWSGWSTTRGYGRISIEGRATLAHRASYEAFVGPIPEGMTIDHLCRRPACIRWDHLEPCSQYENNMRGESPAAVAARATHCKRGHEFSASNTWRQPATGYRWCRTCMRQRAREYRTRRSPAPA